MNIGKFLVIATIIAIPQLVFPAVDTTTLNREAGIPLFDPAGDWSAPKLETSLRRNGIVMRGSRQVRTALLNRRIVFGVQAQEIKCVSTKDGKITVIDIIYFNKGDSGRKRLDGNIRDAARTLRRRLTSLAGKSERGKYGPKKMQNKVEVWKTDAAEFLLEFVPGEFTILHIRKPSGADENSDNVSSTRNKDFSVNCINCNFIYKCTCVINKNICDFIFNFFSYCSSYITGTSTAIFG